MAENVKVTEEKIESLLFKIVEKPKNLSCVKIINVFDNKYRINVWISYEENNLIKNKIKNSYFAKFKNNELILL